MCCRLLRPIIAAGIIALAYLMSSPTAGEDHPSAVDLATAKPRLMVQLGHSNEITSVAYSPDGNLLLTGSDDRTAVLWDAATGKELRRFLGHSDRITSVAFSPDGKQVLTGSFDKTGDEKTTRLWDLRTGKEICGFTAGTVRSIAFSPDSKEVLTVGLDGWARLWNITTCDEIRKFGEDAGSTEHVAILPGGNNPLLRKGTSALRASIKYAAILPDGKNALTADTNGIARFWNIETGAQTRGIDVGRSDVISSDGKRVMTATGLWDLESGKETWRFRAGADPITAATFSPSAKRLITICDGGEFSSSSLRLLDAATGTEIRRIDVGKVEVTAVAFSPNGDRVLTGDGFGTSRLWDLSTGKDVGKLGGLIRGVSSAAFSPDGKQVLSGSYDRAARLWDAASGSDVRDFRGHGGWISAVAFSHDAKRMITGSGDDTAVLWDIASGNQIRRFFPKSGGHASQIRSVAISPNGQQVLAGSTDSRAHLWDAASGTEIRRFENKGAVLSLAFSPNGEQVLTGSDEYGGTARLWEAGTGKQIRKFEGGPAVSFSPDGKVILTRGDGNTAVLWDAASGKEIRRLEGHSSSVESVSFSPDGKQVLTGSGDATARLWDAASGKEIRRFEGHASLVNSVALSPDGKQVLTGSEDGTSRIWDAATGKELCELVAFINGEWAVVDPEGRFDASNHGKVDGLHWVIDNEPIDLAQLKDRYYDPGLLAKKMGFNKDSLREVEAFDNPKLYPEVAITPPAAGQTRFDIHLTNRGGGIGQVVVRINGKDAITDARGSRTDPNAAAATLPIDLAGDRRLKRGEENEIEVLAFNADGLIKSRGIRIPYLDPRAKRPVGKPDVWAIVVGVSHYQGGAIDLRYPAKDAEDFSKALKIAAGRLVGADKFHLTLLTSPLPDAIPLPNAIPGPDASHRPTHDNILGAIKALRDGNNVKESDILIVYLAGHGVTGGGADSSFYYLTADAQQADSIDPQVRRQSSVSDLEIIKEIMDVPAQRRVMILDTCHSGRFIDNLSKPREPDTSEIIALERIRDHTGFHVLAGCAAERASYEASHFNQGVLTYSLLRGMRGEALKDGRFVDVWTLFDFAVENVPRLAGDIKGIQQPQTYSDKGSTFPFGEITACDQPLIPLAKTRPLVLRADFHDADEQDPLDLSDKLNDRFREITYGQGDPAIEFVDAAKLTGAYRVSGSYQVEGENVTGTVRIALQPPEPGKIKSFAVSGNKTNIAALVAEITAEMQQRLPKPTAAP